MSIGNMTKTLIALLALQISCAQEDSTEDDVGQYFYPKGYSQVRDSTVSLRFQGATGLGLTAEAISVTDSSGSDIGVLQLSEAKIVLDKIKIKMEAAGTESAASASLSNHEEESESESESESGDDESELEFEFPGPFLVDLITNEVTPDPGSLDLPAGNYKEIVLSMHKVEDEDAATLGVSSSDDIYGHSFLAAGTYTPTGGTLVNVNIAYEFGEDFKIRGNKGVDISSETVNDMVVAFRLAKWFDFANSETNPDSVNFSSLPSGDITLNKDSDDAGKDIRKVIKENVKESADFGKDEDGDGKLSNDEDAEEGEEEDDDDE